jgi:hypothetical protein
MSDSFDSRSNVLASTYFVDKLKSVRDSSTMLGGGGIWGCRVESAMAREADETGSTAGQTMRIGKGVEQLSRAMG